MDLLSTLVKTVLYAVWVEGKIPSTQRWYLTQREMVSVWVRYRLVFWVLAYHRLLNEWFKYVVETTRHKQPWCASLHDDLTRTLRDQAGQNVLKGL